MVVLTWSPFRVALARSCRDAGRALAARRAAQANRDGLSVDPVLVIEDLG